MQQTRISAKITNVFWQISETFFDVDLIRNHNHKHTTRGFLSH